MNKKDGKKIQKIKHSDIIEKIKEFKNNNHHFYNSNSFLNDKNISTRNASIISKNLKKYSITKKKYDIFIVNSIIFEQKGHIVTEFKNNLYWDETSEFLKRFYYLMESLERIPNISQYYETYTLFAPIYFGLECTILIIMNLWTIRKKKYLEYLEDKEEENEQNKENNNVKNSLKFKKMIKSNLVSSESSKKKSKSSIKTLDLTKYDDVDSFFINSIDLSLIEKGNHKNYQKENIKNISLSKIMDDLFNNYSNYKTNNKNIDEEKNKLIKNLSKNNKNEINKQDNNIVSSDKVLFSFSNLYKNRNNKNSFKKRINTNINSNSKIKIGQLNEKKNKEKLFICKMNNKVNIHLYETKKNNIKKKFNTQKNYLQITINNLTRNKSIMRDKKDKDNIINNIITNTHINTTSNNNSTNNSLSKFKIRKQKKKLFLRNLKLFTPPYNYKRYMANSPEVMDTNKNDNNMQKNKYNLTRLLTYKICKSKDLLNRNNINISNIKNFNSTRYLKVNNSQTNYDPLAYKINQLTKEKRILTTANSFSNKKNSNSKLDKKSSKNKNEKKNQMLIDKKLSNGNIIRNLVLNKFHSKKEIMNKSKNNLNQHNSIYSFTKKSISRNNTLVKSKKRTFTKKCLKKTNDSLSIKPYKKESNKINLNFNFNINFNIDINKNRHKKYLLTHKNIGYLTQRNQIIRGGKINKSKSKTKSKGRENLHKKNIMIALIKNIKKDNYGLRKNIK
jgi:hypothetical protein